MSLSRKLVWGSTLEDAESAQLDRLYRQHHQRVFAVCMRFGGSDRAWAMDRTHDVFVTLAEKLASLRDTGDLDGWLYRVAVNACLMDLRKRRGLRAVLHGIGTLFEAPPATPERSARDGRDATRLEQAIAALPPKQRAIVVLVHLEGRTQSEAASLLSLSEGQVSKLHKRALEALRTAEWEAERG